MKHQSYRAAIAIFSGLLLAVAAWAAADEAAARTDQDTARRLATARANNSKEHASVAMAALVEVLRLDPKNKEALALRDSVRAYFAMENSIGLKFVYIPAGEFDMGSPGTEAGRLDRETLHHVKITKPFLMATTTVTQAEWKAIMVNNPSKFLGGNRPVEMVSWNQAVAFCEKLSAKEGKHYRLSTGAEWEYACRAGTQTPFSFGDASLDDFAWYSANSRNETHDVATKKPNRWGLYDVHGNVCQWCSDGFGPYGGDAVDPKGADDTSMRVLRGGSWADDRKDCRAACYDGSTPGYRGSDLGCRVCLDF